MYRRTEGNGQDVEAAPREEVQVVVVHQVCGNLRGEIKRGWKGVTSLGVCFWFFLLCGGG